jgi:hypothetical protein
VNDITDENGRVSQDYLIKKLKNKIDFFSEFSRLKKAIPKEWYVQNLSKYFLGITFQFDVFGLSSLLTHDTLSDLNNCLYQPYSTPPFHNPLLKLIF